MQVTTTVPKLLFLSDSYDEGWKVTINGKPVPLYRADYTFRAVSVPMGESTVIMEYVPWSIGWGSGISAVALGIIVLYGVQKKRV
jgi:uncharacterized membrane protein YfhO